MVINYKKILIKIVSICILILFLMQIFKDSTIIFCEMSTMSHEEALNILKESAYCNLYELIRQEDFKSVYGKTWIYANIILEENFLMEFLEKIQWRTFDEETKNMTSEAKLYKINDIFMSYIEHLQLDWLIEYCQNLFQPLPLNNQESAQPTLYNLIFYPNLLQFYLNPFSYFLLTKNIVCLFFGSNCEKRSFGCKCLSTQRPLLSLGKIVLMNLKRSRLARLSYE